MSWLRSKLRQVAARASDALAQAADMVAPTLYESRVDEFHHRWTTVARFLESVLSRDLEPAEQRRLLLESHTRDSLLKLVLLIYEEENNSDRWEMVMARPKAAEDAVNAEVRTRARSRAQSQTPLSPPQQEHASHECLEYLLEKQIIPHLCEVGRRDQPCGIMSLAMQFVGALLSRVSYPILPTREVHVSVVALIQAAARKEVEDPTVRKYLISLLNILWKKLRGDPVQTEFFFLHADRLMVRTTDMNPEAGEADPFLHLHNHHTQSEVPELILFTGLLPHMYAMGKIGEKCREALVIAAAVHDKALCRFVLQLTPFCHYAVNGVISAFDALPKTLASTAKTPAAAVSPADPDASMDVELSFLAVRLRFCCTLAMVARYELEEVNEVTGDLQRRSIADELLRTEFPCCASAVLLHTRYGGTLEEVNEVTGDLQRRSIADELLDQFRTRFLEGPLLEGLLHTSEAAACAATLYARIILEELTACGRDTRANPLLFIYLQFLLERANGAASTKAITVIAEDGSSTSVEPETQAEEPSVAQQLPSELLRHMDSLSSSLCIATIDLFTSVLELQDEYADSVLLGAVNKAESDANSENESSPRKRRPSSSLVSPGAPTNGAIWFASRFPDSSVASNVHLWKIRAFAGPEEPAEVIPAADDQEDQVLSLLSYIADAEYAACQRGPEELDDSDEDDADLQDDAAELPTATAEEIGGSSPPAPAAAGALSPSRGSSTRTAATRNSMKPLRDVYLSISLPSFSPAEPAGLRQRSQSQFLQRLTVGSDEGTMPLFLRIVLSRVERLLENSFQENLALSGLIYSLAQKARCSTVMFDLDETLPAGQSLRSILEEVYADALRRLNRLPNGATQLQELRKKLVDEDNDAALNDHEAETRLLCGYVVLDEVLKELCSLLFARERVKTLPLKPEGYYLEPKRVGSPTVTMQRERALSSETLFSDEGSQIDAASPRKQGSIGKEFEALLAEAQSSMDDLLVGAGEDTTPALEAELETQIV
ncbi:LOW QUALITY PROTEIN: hypothetical protein PHMEG_0002810 [Phytophthora megakarya]|uniref:FHF complex subunit HOOK-interacting protein C-terminal domain-containing protein n=1 Tax=Phytophthora megakarya TaxID=4795 RepID=A0A225WXJ3_9STRA|nr:LOW QUALITY PROTEIN: hypothetical protein PHMEG_0002810 [Phytophthora megakarya]